MRNKFNSLLSPASLLLLLTALSCTSSKPTTTTADQTGDSKETAIIINTPKGEYQWLNEKYPNVRILVEEVVKEAGKSYNVVTIRTEAEERITYYFDITKVKKK